MADPLRLYGLKALVINAGSGIGEASARTLIKHGATVLAVDSINSGVEQHFKAVKGIEGYSANLTDSTLMPGLVEEAVKRLGQIDILINDFPLRADAPLVDGDGKLTGLLEIRSALLMSICRAAMPHLQKSPAGRIINIGFLRSTFAADGTKAFAESEQDLSELTTELASETGEFGTTANYVQPGAIMTPASRDAFKKDMALRDFCIANSAARRLGEPVDIAKVVLFLASEDAAFVNGTGIVVDGGRSNA
jgi:3-oxoacyl-[acyl-carrier protein] reductase